MKNKYVRRPKEEFLKRFPASSWPFIAAVVLFVLGVSFSLTLLTVAGGFVILLYVLIWVLWIIEATR